LKFPLLKFVFVLVLCTSAAAQSTTGPNRQPASDVSAIALPDAPLPQTVDPVPSDKGNDPTLRNTPIHILNDQAAIWTSPARVRERDFVILLPLGLATAAAITTDQRAMTSVVSHDALFIHRNVQVSDFLTGGLIGAPVTLMGIGHFHANPHAMESGILSGEALIDGVVVEQGMKLMFWRERPSQDQAKGKFFQQSAGIDSSFPSSHSLLAWSSASVLAHEYPSRWVQLSVYSMAAGVSLTRILGQQHFPSDVLVGSAAGWLIGRYVYHRHHKIRLE
jgi:hypothetical protein